MTDKEVIGDGSQFKLLPPGKPMQVEGKSGILYNQAIIADNGIGGTTEHIMSDIAPADLIHGE